MWFIYKLLLHLLNAFRYFDFYNFSILDDPVRQINENEKVGSVLFDPDGGDAFICGTDEDANDLLFMNLTDYNLGLYTERVPPTEWIVTIASQDISATARTQVTQVRNTRFLSTLLLVIYIDSNSN